MLQFSSTGEARLSLVLERFHRLGVIFFGHGDLLHNQLRINLLQVLIAESVLFRGTRAEVLTECIYVFDQLIRELPCLALSLG